MSKDWEYAKVTKWIAEHGGTQKALETVKNYYMKKGFKEGAASKNPVIALVGAVCLAAGVAGKCVYDKIMEKKTLEVAEQVKVKKAEAELVTAMQQDTKAENEANGKQEENSPEPTEERTRI